jgi:hypothetical protein
VSYEVPQQRRPGSVTAAGYLLYLVAVVIVIDAIVGIASASAVKDATVKAYESAGIPNADSLSGAATAGAIIGAVIYILLAVGLFVLGALDMRGKNAARIVTWVLAGIGVLCFCLASVGGLASGAILNSTPASPNGVSASDLAKQIKDAEPSWLQPTQTALAIISLLALILVIILLALPASNAYFRGAPAGGGPGYPTYPQYGTPPGGQPYPGEPPYPGQQPPPGNEPPYPGAPSA